MERLSLHDQSQANAQRMPSPQPQMLGQGQGPGQAQGPPMVPQLPPQMFTTAASLLDLTDKKLMVQLRDGRKLIGVLRSWDQFGNLVLQNTVRRHFSTTRGLFGDEPMGLQLIRGENILIMGEIDLDREDDNPAGWQQGDWAEVKAAEDEEEAASKGKNAKALQKLQALGFEGEHAGEVLF